MIEKIKEKIIPLALIAVLIYIAYMILQGLNKISYAFSLESRGRTFGEILLVASEPLQFRLVFPLSIFLLLSAYLPSFEKHSRKLRIVGVITVLFMHFGNFLSFWYLSKHPGIPLIMFVIYGVLLLTFLSKKWLPLSMAVLGVTFVLYSLIFFIYPTGSYILPLILLVYGLIVVTVGVINLRNYIWMKNILKVEAAALALIGIYWLYARIGGT